MQFLVLLPLVVAFATAAPVASIADHWLVAREKVNPDCGTGDDFCKGANNTAPDIYLCGDFRLGPLTLPTKLPLDNLIFKYDRLGGLCPGEFLEKYTNATTGSFVFPPHDGFLLDVHHKPIKGNVTLKVGTLLDRFGSETGTFMSPAFSPYIQRALPPVNLDPPREAPPNFPNNYHIYKVAKKFVVQAGPIAPAFGQPGQGTQYETTESVATLVAGGFLERVNKAQF
ncbi:hypothetical protein EXIGLDRAFT_834944 [Exidia glandulosa HHB12029]|uniref:TNT domain-containing protein n=1 Tax=Exidia glandulosa HHB12029 TaxID=1314781 RepID=A0A165J9F6_EXIGL|nr:hypothetical protein EXIGLDRAFT_834944 [Exidia glandulosa HHB12029]